MQKIISQLDPLYVLLVHLTAVLAAPLFIKFESKNLLSLTTVVLVPIVASIAVALCYKIFCATNKKIVAVPVNYLKFVSLIVFLCSALEYLYFGLPIFGHTNYHKLGFSIIHHISVSSWIWVILAFSYNSRMIRNLLLCFAIINPLLMLNRDVLLLTFFVILVLKARESERMSNLRILILALLCFYAFGLVGEIRSPYGLALIRDNVPLTAVSNAIFDYNKKLLWPLIYVSGSIFNAANHISGYNTIYYENLNAISEFVRFYNQIGFLYPIIFYIGTTTVMLVVRQFSNQSPYFDFFYVYFYYQFFMSIFSTKVYITNTLFVFTLFCVIPIFLPRKAKTQ